jgi:Ca2+-binding EF-hand superfamily protein
MFLLSIKVLDTDGNGRISFEELRAWLGRLGKGLSAREVFLLLEAIDMDGDHGAFLHPNP